MANVEDGKVNTKSRDELAKGINEKVDKDVDDMLEQANQAFRGTTNMNEAGMNEVSESDEREIKEMQALHDKQIAEGKFDELKMKEYMGVQRPIKGSNTLMDHPMNLTLYSIITIHERLKSLYTNQSIEYKILMSYAKMVDFDVVECKFIMDETSTGVYRRNELISGTNVFEAKYMELMITDRR